MYKKFSLLLASILTLSVLPSTVQSFENPLKTYSLYEDIHRTQSAGNPERETVMGEYYNNSLRAPGNNTTAAATASTPPKETPSYSDSSSSTPNNSIEDRFKNRNQILRESSRKIYSNPSEEAVWEHGPYFYKNPSLDSIKEKYKKSNFAGCMQEAEAYVKKNPKDTLGYYYLAMSYAKTGNKDNAVKAYEKVISLNENPMIVKYATNGRNCVMNNGEQCYITNPTVNEPILVYPYADIAAGKTQEELTLVDPKTLINKNISELQGQLSQVADQASKQGDANDKNGKEALPELPFRTQDEELDRFINSPYGNGLSPALNNEYKSIQLRKLQQNINNEQGSQGQNLDNVQKFDKSSDAGLAKLAYIEPSSLSDIAKSPEYSQYKKELEEMKMILGNSSNKKGNDLLDLLPYMSGGDKDVSPEVIQAMMMQSMAIDFIGNN